MRLKSTLDNLDGLDEAFKALYTEKDGKFYLNIDGIDEHHETAGLKRTIATLREEKKAIEKRATDAEAKIDGLPSDFTVEKYHALVDANAGGDVDKRLKEQRESLTTQMNTAVAKEKDRADKAIAARDKLYLETSMNDAMAEANITLPAMQKAVKAMMIGQAKVDFEDDKPIVTIDGLPVADKLKAFAATDEGKYFVTAEGNSGGGSGGHQKKNPPVAYDKMGLTELMQKASAGDQQATAELAKREKQ